MANNTGRRHWRNAYWLIAAAPPLLLYGLEALRVTLYHTARSPNATLAAQLALTLGVFLLWVFAPRAIWVVTADARRRGDEPKAFMIRLAALGAGLSTVHLFVLTLHRLYLHADHAWQWRPIHVLHNYGEVWLSYGAAWLTAYGIVCFIIFSKLAERAEPLPKASRLEIRDKGEMLFIPLDEIYWVKAAGNYVELYTTRGVKMVRKTLSQFEKELAQSGFLKAHRSALVNARHVCAIKNEGGGLTVRLEGGHAPPLSRRRVAAFRALISAAARNNG